MSCKMAVVWHFSVGCSIDVLIVKGFKELLLLCVRLQVVLLKFCVWFDWKPSPTCWEAVDVEGYDRKMNKHR